MREIRPDPRNEVTVANKSGADGSSIPCPVVPAALLTQSQPAIPSGPGPMRSHSVPIRPREISICLKHRAGISAPTTG